MEKNRMIEATMLSARTNRLIRELAGSQHVPEDTLIRDALHALLREKKRAIQNDLMDILVRYKVSSVAALDEKINKGTLPESPAWEDRIVLDNLEEALRKIDSALASL
jgi:hypothetical protein